MSEIFQLFQFGINVTKAMGQYSTLCAVSNYRFRAVRFNQKKIRGDYLSERFTNNNLLLISNTCGFNRRDHMFV